MHLIVDQLHLGLYSCVIYNEGKVRSYTQRGVADLYDILNSDEADFLKGAQIADKVIGRAAAALLIKGGIAEVYAEVMSEGALTLLEQHGIEVQYVKLVSHIINRDKSGWCPLELLTRDLEDIEDMYVAIDKFISNMREQKQDRTSHEITI